MRFIIPTFLLLQVFTAFNVSAVPSDSTAIIAEWCRQQRIFFEQANYRKAALYYDSLDNVFPDTVANEIPDFEFGISEPIAPFGLVTPEPIDYKVCYMGNISYQKLAEQADSKEQQKFNQRAEQIYDKGVRLYGALQMMQELHNDKLYESYEKQPHPIPDYATFYASIENSIKYQASLVEGKVFIQFIVEKDSSIRYTHIVKGVHEYYNEQVSKFMKSSQWVPAQLKGKPVRSILTIPIPIKNDR
ncbi:hypothetical protein WJR50_23745 [Catalinimonas sp. 4WD22]|uniref:energy transducer TonB n=1 Tax=Catalinimonas locisalis TaxID=3133978 RepID=UPI00310126C2